MLVRGFDGITVAIWACINKINLFLCKLDFLYFKTSCVKAKGTQLFFLFFNNLPQSSDEVKQLVEEKSLVSQPLMFSVPKIFV